MLDSKDLSLLRGMEPYGRDNVHDIGGLILGIHTPEQSSRAAVMLALISIGKQLERLRNDDIITYAGYHPNSYDVTGKPLIDAAITGRGLEVLQAEEQRISVIATNNSTLEFIRLQKGVLRQQTRIYIYTLVVAGLSAIVAGFTLFLDYPIKRAQQRRDQSELTPPPPPVQQLPATSAPYPRIEVKKSSAKGGDH